MHVDLIEHATARPGGKRGKLGNWNPGGIRRNERRGGFRAPWRMRNQRGRFERGMSGIEREDKGGKPGEHCDQQHNGNPGRAR